jgi:hypothetical protein
MEPQAGISSTEASNLTVHRTSPGVWEKRGWQGPTIEERVVPWLISLGGVSLLAYGMSRRSWRNAWAIASGATLIGCAAAGLCDPRTASMRVCHQLRRPGDDHITTESIDSFPASDAPSSNATTAGPRPVRKRS